MLDESAKRGQVAEALKSERVPLEPLFAQFIRALEIEARSRGRSDRYASTIRADLENHILTRWEYPQEITHDSWEAAAKVMHATGSQIGDPPVWSGNIKWRTIRRIGVSLRHLLDYCVKVGALESEPTPRLEMPDNEQCNNEEAERLPLTPEQRDALFAEFKASGNERALRHYRLMFLEGFRKSTVERMTPRWVNMETGLIKIPGKKYKNRKKGIEFYLEPESLQAIRERLAEKKDAAKGESVVSLDQPIFGKFDHRTLFDAAVKRINARGGVQIDLYHGEGEERRRVVTTHHVARHSWATLAGELGASDRQIMAQMGVTSASVVQRYVHATAEMADAAKALDRRQRIPTEKTVSKDGH